METIAEIVIGCAVVAYARTLLPQTGEPLWEVPFGWLPRPYPTTVVEHMAHGAGSVADVLHAASWDEIERAWDEAHEDDWWFAYRREMDAAVAAFRASDAVIRRAHRTTPCRFCAHPFTDEPTSEHRIVPRRALVGAA